MCEILEQMRSEAMEQGIQQGIEQGMQRGMQQKLLDNIRSLMETLQLSSEQAMDALKVPKVDRARYLAML